MQVHKIIVGDTLTPLGVQLKQKSAAGVLSVVDLSNSTCKFLMVAANGVVKVAETDSNVTITDASNGKVQYDFQSTDVDTPGTYYAWFKNYSGGECDTFPTAGRELKVIITAAG